MLLPESMILLVSTKTAGPNWKLNQPWLMRAIQSGLSQGSQLLIAKISFSQK